MPKFKRRETLVEAEQFTTAYTPKGVMFEHGTQRAYVITIHGGSCPVEHGDWIIQEPDGLDHYPVKDEIFRSYEKVSD